MSSAEGFSMTETKEHWRVLKGWGNNYKHLDNQQVVKRKKKKVWDEKQAQELSWLFKVWILVQSLATLHCLSLSYYI